MRNLYFHDRDKNGQLKFSKPKRNKLPTVKEAFFLVWRHKGLRDDLIQKLWDEQHGG